MWEAVSTRPRYETRARSSPRCLLHGFPQPVKDSPMTRDEINKENEGSPQYAEGSLHTTKSDKLSVHV